MKVSIIPKQQAELKRHGWKVIDMLRLVYQMGHHNYAEVRCISKHGVFIRGYEDARDQLGGTEYYFYREYGRTMVEVTIGYTTSLEELEWILGEVIAAGGEYADDLQEGLEDEIRWHKSHNEWDYEDEMTISICGSYRTIKWFEKFFG